jgi:hypothetical protein
VGGFEFFGLLKNLGALKGVASLCFFKDRCKGAIRY